MQGSPGCALRQRKSKGRTVFSVTPSTNYCNKELLNCGSKSTNDAIFRFEAMYCGPSVVTNIMAADS